MSRVELAVRFLKGRGWSVKKVFPLPFFTSYKVAFRFSDETMTYTASQVIKLAESYGWKG